MHLRYCMYTACDIREGRHPQEVMADIGIAYQHATPQSVADCWEFWNCENVPKNLPAYLKELNVGPTKRIGYGLSEEDAKNIVDHSCELNKRG